MTTSATIGAYLPAAKIGNNNYVYVWSTVGIGLTGVPIGFYGIPLSVNYFGIASVQNIAASSNNGKFSGTFKTIPVIQAYNIDAKIDDGSPTTGNVLAIFMNNGPQWVNGSTNFDITTAVAPLTGGVNGSGTCFNNGGVSGAPWVYSTSSKGGASPACALSFIFQ